jgi:hypothetical protein
MPKPEEYKHIAAWGTMMNSFSYYIEMQQEEAAADNAAIDAIYKRDGAWRTYGQVSNPETVAIMDRLLKEMDHA